jgi:hypothetical protein
MASRGRGKMPSGFQVIPYQEESEAPKSKPVPAPPEARPPVPEPPQARTPIPPPQTRAPMPQQQTRVPMPPPVSSAIPSGGASPHYTAAQKKAIAATDYKHIPLFEGMDDVQIALLINQATPLNLNSGDVVFREGIKEDTLFLLQMGRCDVAHAGRSIATLGAGTVFGEMALVSDRPRSATITADRLCTLKVWEADTLHTIFDLDPEIGMLLYRNLGKILAQRLYRANVDKRNAGR